MGLKDKVCIITGAGSGIGRSTAIRMAKEGATIILVGRTESKLQLVQQDITVIGVASKFYTLDVSDYQSVLDMADDVMKSFGQIDVLVNNAGHSSHNRRVLSTTPDEIRNVINSNLIGTIFCTKAVLPSMLQAHEGTIVNISSLSALNAGVMGGMIYGAAKSAIINFTEFLNNADLKNTGIRASVVIPGEVDTPVLDKRPIPPPSDARSNMVGAEEAAEAITLVASLPSRTNIPQLIIRPTMQRETSETVGFP